MPKGKFTPRGSAILVKPLPDKINGVLLSLKEMAKPSNKKIRPELSDDEILHALHYHFSVYATQHIQSPTMTGTGLEKQLKKLIVEAKKLLLTMKRPISRYQDRITATNRFFSIYYAIPIYGRDMVIGFLKRKGFDWIRDIKSKIDLPTLSNTVDKRTISAMRCFEKATSKEIMQNNKFKSLPDPYLPDLLRACVPVWKSVTKRSALPTQAGKSSMIKTPNYFVGKKYYFADWLIVCLAKARSLDKASKSLPIPSPKLIATTVRQVVKTRKNKVPHHQR